MAEDGDGGHALSLNAVTVCVRFRVWPMPVAPIFPPAVWRALIVLVVTTASAWAQRPEERRVRSEPPWTVPDLSEKSERGRFDEELKSRCHSSLIIDHKGAEIPEGDFISQSPPPGTKIDCPKESSVAKFSVTLSLGPPRTLGPASTQTGSPTTAKGKPPVGNPAPLPATSTPSPAAKQAPSGRGIVDGPGPAAPGNQPTQASTTPDGTRSPVGPIGSNVQYPASSTQEPTVPVDPPPQPKPGGWLWLWLLPAAGAFVIIMRYLWPHTYAVRAGTPRYEVAPRGAVTRAAPDITITVKIPPPTVLVLKPLPAATMRT